MFHYNQNHYLGILTFHSLCSLRLRNTLNINNDIAQKPLIDNLSYDMNSSTSPHKYKYNVIAVQCPRNSIWGGWR